MGMSQGKKHCIVCNSLTVARVRISTAERVPICPVCISELDFAEYIKPGGASA